MEQLINKQKAEITYRLLQKRKERKSKQNAIILKEYLIDMNTQRIKNKFKANKFKKCKSSH